MNVVRRRKNLSLLFISFLILALIGLAIWYFVFRESKNPSVDSTEQTDNQQSIVLPSFEKECTLNDTFTGTQFVNTNSLYSVCLPNGWAMNGQEDQEKGSIYLAYSTDVNYS